MNNPPRMTNRTTLLNVLQANVRSSSIRRAVDDGGKVEVLGGFKEIPPANESGWVVQITSKHKRMWLVAVVPKVNNHSYQVYRISEIHWIHWEGKPIKEPFNVYNGDNPLEYDKRRREKCVTQTTK